LARACRLLVGAAFVASIVAARPATGAPATVGFRGAGRDGRFAGTLPRTLPAAVWTFATGGPVRSSPLLADGVVFFGSGDGNLYAVDAATGKERWRFTTGEPVDGSPAYAAPRAGAALVVVASRDGFLHAVDAASGRERWRLALGAELPFHWGWDFILSTPAVDGDRLYVGSGSGEVLAVDAASGKVIWRHATAGRVRSSPTVADGVVYVGSFDGHLYALDAATGAERWTFATEGTKLDSVSAGFDRQSIQGSPAVSADQVVIGGRDGMFYGVDRATGKQRWRIDHGMPWVIASPAIADGKAVVGSSDGRFVTAVDLAVGKEVWRSRTGSNQLSSPAVAGGVVVVGDFTGAVIALDLTSGRELWRFLAGDGVFSSPLVVDGTIFFGSDDGKLYALRGDLAAQPHRHWRAVYWDPFVGYSFMESAKQLRDALVDASYRHVGRAGVIDFMNARIADREPSVIVFAQDAVPSTLLAAGQGGTPSIVRRYLDAGGKVVWIGYMPFGVSFDPESSKLEQASPFTATGERILGVDLADDSEGVTQVEATAAGRAWGLPGGWWTDEPVLVSQPGVEVLAADRHGHATAWVKSFGGPPGSGFVRLWGRPSLPDPAMVRAVAEHGLP
ncbi:MAG TPA: PQQ-binding-like beta-propeller repeat protein, partial [Thermoanaerobaculia bacterium]|nr:PQQ-binding-like beta-propeller repeat protein [Thermoanaerobaculia bacterium]